MDTYYPESPRNIPLELRQPTKAYKHRAWLAGVSLVGFVLVYLFLAGWFVFTAWRLISDAVISDGGGFANWLVGSGAAFLAVFMLKGLFFIQRGNREGLIEMKASEQPQLFQFLHRLADDAGAPRPAKVYLSAKVNAAVFYDLSILNLLLPSRKNLEIGLPLVNVLNLGEFKAVLAHEFGHFAQRSMAIGSWVYIAQQIASQLIHRRDALDKFLSGLANTDFRIAWVGWLLSLIVWSIRSLMDSLLRLVTLAQRALSRQMEFQADLVAVSLTGSDEIVNALHKLQAADEAWSRTLNFAHGQFSQGRQVPNLLAIQTRIIATMARILDDPAYGTTPQPDSLGRVFKTSFAHPPQMWATHPASYDRENNAKRIPIPSRRDDRSACLLVANLAALEAALAKHVLASEEGEMMTPEDSLAALDERYRLRRYESRYRGAFLGRPLTRHATSVAELYDAKLRVASLEEAIACLYPTVLASDLAKLRELEEECGTLTALHEGHFQARENRLVFRGQEVSLRELPALMDKVRGEAAVVRERITEHDRRCRSLHLLAARQLGKGWSPFLEGLMAVLHFAEHGEADLRDVQGMLSNVYAVVTADGKVSAGERKRLVKAGNEVHAALDRIYTRRTALQLDTALLARLETASWSAMLGDEFKLPPASDENLAGWLQAVDSWINAAVNACSALANASLEELLCAEDQVAAALASPTALAEAPGPSVLPESYATLLPGQERPRQTKLGWWDRFQVADGPVFSVIRLLGAGSIVGAVLGFSGTAAQETDISIFNGLNRPISVQVGETDTLVPPYSGQTIAVKLNEKTELVASTSNRQEIERFTPEVQGRSRHYVYNIAAAGPLIHWTANYGNASGVPPQLLGAKRWQAVSADVYFADPPASVSSKSGGATRTVISGPPPNADPEAILDKLGSAEEKHRVAALHAKWDKPDALKTKHWQELAGQ